MEMESTERHTHPAEPTVQGFAVWWELCTRPCGLFQNTSTPWVLRACSPALSCRESPQMFADIFPVFCSPMYFLKRIFYRQIPLILKSLTSPFFA